MEYIREVLERQEAALRRLLLGRREGETGAERTAETARRAGRKDTGRGERREPKYGRGYRGRPDKGRGPREERPGGYPHRKKK